MDKVVQVFNCSFVLGTISSCGNLLRRESLNEVTAAASKSQSQQERSEKEEGSHLRKQSSSRIYTRIAADGVVEEPEEYKLSKLASSNSMLYAVCGMRARTAPHHLQARLPSVSYLFSPLWSVRGRDGGDDRAVPRQDASL
jgi:hypothetical protein